ncbi:MAG: maleate cis-trans isomerase family protein [Propylenella sp.]
MNKEAPGAFAALAPDAAPVHPSAAIDPASPPTINLGWRLRLGVIQASVNTVAEPQMQAMAPPGVYLHTTRLKLVGSSDAEILGMAEKVEEAALLLADADPARILFHCTATATYEADMSARIAERITKATGIPAHATSECIVAALKTLRARKIVMATPYIRSVNEREVKYFAANGIEVVREFGLDLPGGREFRRVEPAEWYRLVMEHRRDEADAYFISCANVRAAEVIETLERDLDRPVVTSNTASVWRLLRASGVNDPVAGFGTLLREF